MLLTVPLSCAIDPKPSGINDNVTRMVGHWRRDCDPQCPLSPTNCAKVGHRQVESHKTPDRGDETLSGSQAQAIDAFHHKGTVNSRVGVYLGSARASVALGVFPSRQRRCVNPEGKSPSGDQGLMVSTPIRNTVSEGVCVVCHRPL
jgi:hypothetical protein